VREKEISFPDGGMVASDSGMSTYSCNKTNYHHRVKHLESRVRELEAELAIADKGLLKASDPKSGWAGISKECKLWQERAEQAEAERDRLKEEVDGIKHSLNTWIGNATKYANELSELRARHAALVEAASDICSDPKHYDYRNPDGRIRFNKLKAALAEVKHG
jgi:chromosome segregation ATPase